MYYNTLIAPQQLRPIAQIADFAYHIFGLDFLSREPIPGAARACGIAAKDAIRIEFGRVPVCIRAPEYEDELVQTTGAEYLFHYPKIGRIYVQGGERITIEPAPDADPAGMWQIVMGVGASIAGFRRGFVPIHASAVVHGDNCVAFAGQSTSGKSTIAALLTRLGFGFHADDLCLAHCSDGKVEVGTGVQEVRLCEDAIGMVGWSNRESAAYFADSGKSLFRWTTPQRGPRALRRIYVLEFASGSSAPGVYRIGGVAALQALIDCLRIRLPLLMTGARQKNFERMAAVTGAVEMFRFVRPRDPEQSWHWAGILAEHFDR